MRTFVLSLAAFVLLAQIPIYAAPPSNDNFSNAASISNFTGTITGTNVEATKEIGEPPHAANGGGASVWFKWRIDSVMAQVTFLTDGSSFDTLLAVYTGSSVNALSPVASNDDTIGNKSLVTFAPAVGVDYYLAVDGYNRGLGPETGSIVLTWSGPANDYFKAAIVLSGAAVNTSASSVNATSEPNEPAHAGSAASHSVWWCWTPPQAGDVTITTAGSDFDTVLAVYVGAAINSLSMIASNDDVHTIPPIDRTSRVTFIIPEPIPQYWIAVDGFNDGSGGVSGAITLNIMVNPPTPTPTPTPTATESPTPTPSISPTASATPSPTPFNDAALVAQNIPAQIATSHNIPISIQMRNTGNTAWTFAAGFALMVTTDDCSLSPAPQADLDPSAVVNPNETYTFQFMLYGPSLAGGPCSMSFRMAQQSSPFGEMVSANLTAVDFVNAVLFTGDSIPRTLPPGVGVGFGITARNTGNTTWYYDGNPLSYSLQLVNDSCTIVNQISLIADYVPPGQPYQFLGYLTTPPTAGPCTLQFQMNEIGPGSFGPVYEISLEIQIPPNSARDWAHYE